MLSNKKFYFLILFSLSFILVSCEKERTEDVEEISKYGNPEYVLKRAKEEISENVKVSFKGTFDKDSVVEVVAGEEIMDADNWGIKFHFLKLDGKDLDKEFETDLLEGSFNESLVQKIKFPSFKYELIYYNSQDYFLGSGGGEIFSYIINMEKKEVYYAHLFSDPQTSVSLYLSDNINEKEIKDFFILNFKRDYPGLAVVDKDVDLTN